jgi:hypothetical protein
MKCSPNFKVTFTHTSRGYMVPPDLQIFILIFNLMLLGKSQVINESGGKNRKNPSEDIELFAAHLIIIQAF